MRSATPITSARCAAMRSDSPESSTAVRCAPARAKLIESVPMPQPTSSTRLPSHRSNSAKAGMCGSTRYLRASTSSKYSFDPTGFVEWRMLQGRASQYRWTSAIDLSVELFIVRLAKALAGTVPRSLLPTSCPTGHSFYRCGRPSSAQLRVDLVDLDRRRERRPTPGRLVTAARVCSPHAPEPSRRPCSAARRRAERSALAATPAMRERNVSLTAGISPAMNVNA